MMTIPEIRVGEPAVYGGMTVFPLFGGLPDGGNAIDYLLAHEAMASGTLAVSEVSEAGSIHELLAENSGDCAVLFIEGDELRGAKQNRAVNATILVAARSSTVIPVICTEWGRWAYSSHQFCSGLQLPPTLRRIIKEGAGANFHDQGKASPRPACHVAGDPPKAQCDARVLADWQSVRCGGCAPRKGGRSAGAAAPR